LHASLLARRSRGNFAAVMRKPETELESALGRRTRTMQASRPLWVKSRKARREQMLSAFHPIATVQREQFYVGLVPFGDIDVDLINHPAIPH
jgi:hypothetical protein